MPEKFLVNLIPFLITDCGSGKPKLNTARLLELFLTGAVLVYAINISVTKLEVKMDTIEKHVTVLDNRIYQHMVDFDKTVEDTRLYRKTR